MTRLFEQRRRASVSPAGVRLRTVDGRTNEGVALFLR